MHRSVEFCLCNDRILLKNSIIWLSGGAIEAIEVFCEAGGGVGGAEPPLQSFKLDSHQNGGIQVGKNCTRPEKVERAWETCVLASLA